MAKYSDLSDEELNGAVARYGLELQKAEHIDAGASNTSYRVDCANGTTVVLTALDNQYNLSADIQMQLARYVDQNGIATSAPLVSKDGHLVETVGELRYMLKRYVVGTCDFELSTRYLEPAGAALAKLHTVEPPGWLPAHLRRLNDIDQVLAQFNDQDHADWVRQNISETAPMFSTSSPVTIVHGDYFGDNIVVGSDGQIAILDWETASIDCALMDLGFAAVGLAREGLEFVPQRMQRFLRGYETVRSLFDDERAQLRHAVTYGATVIAYQRYVRYHLRFPEPAKHNAHREMYTFLDSVEQRWPEDFN